MNYLIKCIDGLGIVVALLENSFISLFFLIFRNLHCIFFKIKLYNSEKMLKCLIIVGKYISYQLLIFLDGELKPLRLSESDSDKEVSYLFAPQHGYNYF